MASHSRPQRIRSQRHDYLILNSGYEDNIPSEDRYSDFPSQQTSFSDTFDDIQTIPNLDDTIQTIPSDPILPSESASQATTSQPTIPDPNIFLQPSKRARKSTTKWIWDHFNVTLIDEPWINRSKKKILHDHCIQCKICDWETRDSARYGSTYNMESHLRKHAILAPSASTSSSISQLSIAQSFNKKPKLSVISQLQEDIIQYVIKAKMPFTIIELPAFRQMFINLPISDLNSAFCSADTLKRRIQARFKEQRLQLKAELASTCKSIALSLDLWTSKNNLPILGVIGHWLTPDFIYKERVLEFARLEGMHSGENIASVILHLLSELGLQQKLLTITADNASNNEAMISILHAELQDQGNSQFHGLGSFIRCLAHIINLIVKDILRALKSSTVQEALDICDQLRLSLGYEDILAETALSRLRIFAMWISRSSQRQDSWRHICAYMKVSDRFIQYDVDTRWNSTYQMLDTALKAKAQVNQYLELQSELPQFTEQDWHRLSQLHRVFSQFSELTLYVSEKQPQISMVIPLYYELHDMLKDGAEKKGIFTHLDNDIAAALHQGLVKYQKYYTFMDSTDAYYTALILDPRVKGDLLVNELDTETGQMIINEIQENIHQNYHHISEPVNEVTSEDIIISNQDGPEMRMLQRLAPIIQKPAGSDIDEYFSTSRIPVETIGDRMWLTKWWYAHRDSMPQMAAAARDFLAIPASEVAVERLFSRARDTLGVRRNSLNGDTMRMLMLLDERE